MTGASPEGAAASSDGAAKKDLSNDQLKAYIHKARAKIRKLEEQNKASAIDAGEAEYTPRTRLACFVPAVWRSVWPLYVRCVRYSSVCVCAVAYVVWREETLRHLPAILLQS